MPRPSSKLPFHCSSCQRTFATDVGLYTHQGVEHPASSKRRRGQPAPDEEDVEGHRESAGADARAHRRSRPRARSAPCGRSRRRALQPAFRSPRHGDPTDDDDDEDDDEDEDDGDKDYDDLSHDSSEDDGGGSDSDRSESSERSADPVAPVIPPPAAAAMGGGGGAAAGAQPFVLPVYSERKAPSMPDLEPALSWTNKAISAWIYEYASNEPAKKLLVILKDARFDPADLPATGKTCKKAIDKRIAKEQPLWKLIRHQLTYRSCETRPPRPRWKKAAVVSRGVLPCLVTTITDHRTTDWNQIFHYNAAAPPAPDGSAEEPFFAGACQRGCADAMARGIAMGWPAHRIQPWPYMLSADDLSPDNVGNVLLSPAGFWSSRHPFELRRSLLAGLHVCLFPSLPLGKTRTASLKRDHRRALQESFRTFIDDLNEVFRRGFVIHGSHIKNCPIDDLVLFMPFSNGGVFDSVAAWIWLNRKYFHCYICPASYEDSWTRPSADAVLPVQRVEPVAGLRRVANDPLATPAARLSARKDLEDLHVNPELTAWDSLAETQMGGAINVMPDTFHKLDLGIGKVEVVGVKHLLDDPRAVAGRGHSVSTAAALIDDFCNFGGHNTGYHRLPRVWNFTATRVLSGVMIRSLLMSTLAAFCSMPDIFNEARQTALITVLAATILLMRHANARRWTRDTPGQITSLYDLVEATWDDALGDIVQFYRIKVHIPVHWKYLYIELGAPVQWSTQHNIEALQKILKAAWRHTSKHNPEEQV